MASFAFAVMADVSLFHLRLAWGNRWKKSPKGIRGRIRKTGWGYKISFPAEKLVAGDMICPNYKFDQLGVAPYGTLFLRVVRRDEKKTVLLPLDRYAKKTGGNEIEIKTNLLKGKFYLIENGVEEVTAAS